MAGDHHTRASGPPAPCKLAAFPPGPASHPAHARDLTSQALARIQQHLATTGPDPLIITTRHAVATTTSEDLHDLAAAPIWGLARTAQNEHPGRIILIDTDTDPHHLPPATLATALATGEPQLAIRHNTMHIPA